MDEALKLHPYPGSIHEVHVHVLSTAASSKVIGGSDLPQDLDQDLAGPEIEVQRQIRCPDHRCGDAELLHEVLDEHSAEVHQVRVLCEIDPLDVRKIPLEVRSFAVILPD